MKVNDFEFIALLKEEIENARDKFPDNEKLVAAMQEEAGEVAGAFLDYGQFSRQALEECVQLAAMAMRLATEGDSDYDNWIGLKNQVTQ